LLTVYKPLKDSSGTTVAYVAADITMESILMDEISFLIKELSLFFGVSLVIMCLIAEAMKRGIVIPINRMSKEAISFAHNSDVGRQISLRRVKAIDIRSDDEIQNLYNAFSTMAEDFLAYIIQIKAQNERITRMQDEIVVSFAELVEARDEGTGNHIKKTAAYVEAIARQLKKEGFYADELTDESIARFKRSAPLHDIGKIGDFGKQMYVENILKSGKQSEAKPWKRNPELSAVPHAVRSVKLATLFIDLTEEEEWAILTHDGMYDYAKTFLQGHESQLFMILHWSDMWASRVLEGAGEIDEEKD
jgi:hypothetical protein